MNKAICHYSFHRRAKEEGWSLERFVSEVESFAIEGIDFHAKQVGPVETAASWITASFRHSRLKLTSMSLSTNFNQPKKEDWDEQVANTRKWLDVAVAIKAPICRIFGGRIAKEDRSDAALRAAAWQRMLDGVAAVTREAKARNVVLALENHGGLPCSGQEQVDAIRAVNSPYLRATVDVGNYMNCGQEGVEGVRIAAPYCAYVHLKDFKKVPDATAPWGWTTAACALGEGAVDLAGCLEVLRLAGYTGFVALEYEGAEDERTAVPRCINVMNRLVR